MEVLRPVELVDHHVAEGENGPLVRRQRPDELLDVRRRDDVVVECEEHQLAVGARHQVVRIAQPAEVGIALQDPRARVTVGEATHHVEGVVGRAIVSDEDLEVGPRLRGETVEGPHDEPGAVVGRHQRGDPRGPGLCIGRTVLPHQPAISVASSRASQGAVEYLPVSTE